MVILDCLSSFRDIVRVDSGVSAWQTFRKRYHKHTAATVEHILTARVLWHIATQRMNSLVTTRHLVPHKTTN